MKTTFKIIKNPIKESSQEWPFVLRIKFASGESDDFAMTFDELIGLKLAIESWQLQATDAAEKIAQQTMRHVNDND